MSHPPHPAEPVRWPVMRHRWHTLTFLHWRYPAAAVQRLLPEGLTVETYDGDAWVGLVPFVMRVQPPAGPAVPWLSHFPETDVRTYARDASGRTAVWFLSLDAARLAPVVAGRTAFRLPYQWSRMTVARRDGRVAYRSVRRWLDVPGARLHAVVEPGPPYAADELTELDHFLTARFALWSPRPGGGLLRALAEHPPWQLCRVTVHRLDDQLLTAAGLPAPRGEPLAHWSEGVDVRIGAPRALG